MRHVNTVKINVVLTVTNIRTLVVSILNITT